MKHLAYSTPSEVPLPLGTRIIAQYKEEVKGTDAIPSFYAGIVAETQSEENKFRYLIFFDDGCAEYCNQKEVTFHLLNPFIYLSFLIVCLFLQVLQVCESSDKVWRDVHKESREFVSNYLTKMTSGSQFKKIKLKVGDEVKTELEGEWLTGRVLEVDASMARIRFPTGGGENGLQNHAEWIYRGSTRFWPLFNNELEAKEEPIKIKRGAGRPRKSNTPTAQFIKN